MKKTLLLLTFAITASIANTQTSTQLTAGESIQILTNNQIIIREIRTDREIRQDRKIRAERVIKIENITLSPMARNSREVRKNRFIVQRESRKVRHVFIQDNLHIARLK